MNCLIENDYIKGTFQKKKSPMYSRMNCLIENDYIKGTFQKKKSPMYSRMNCLIENDYIKGTFPKKITYVFTNELPNWKRLHKGTFQKKITYVFTNELPNWKRLHKGTFPKKKFTYVFTNELPNWKRLHKGNFPKKKITYVFTNELPNWKRILKGKNGKKREKTVGVLYYGGGLLFWTGSWRTLLWGGLLIPCWHYICEPPSKSIADAWYENIGYRFFCGALSHLSLYSVLFKSTLNNAKMQRNWLHGFRSLSCRDWIKGRSLSLRLPSCWGAI